jgi:hypothetical protein
VRSAALGAMARDERDFGTQATALRLQALPVVLWKPPTTREFGEDRARQQRSSFLAVPPHACYSTGKEKTLWGRKA